MCSKVGHDFERNTTWLRPVTSKVPGGVHKNNDVRLVTIPPQPRHQKSGQKHKLPRAEQILEAAGSGSDMTG